MPDTTPARRLIVWAALTGLLVLVALVSLGVGRYYISPDKVLGILGSRLFSLEPFWSETDYRVVMLIRLPRVVLAVITGAGLALSGAALQGVFRNPLVGPQIVGVSSGASFGGVLAILLFGGQAALVISAFVFGLAAMFVVYVMSRVAGRSPVLMLVLAGVVTSAFFSALVSLIKYVADPYDKLPAIVFWLMGSLAAVTPGKVLIGGLPILAAGGIVYFMRFRINILSLGDEEAEALGVKVEKTRWLVLLCVTLITAAQVSISGVIGWVGLVIPHLARMIGGPDHRTLLPAAVLTGGIYLLIIDDLARALTASEIPIGIITAVIGAPVFGYLLKKTQAGGWHGH